MSDKCENLEYVDLIREPKMSIDRLVLLLRSPDFCMYQSDLGLQDNRGRLIHDLIEKFKEAFLELYDDTESLQYSLETKLYGYHYRIKDIDIQFCTKMALHKKIDDQDYIEAWGNEEEKAKGYMYEFYSHDYNIRIEYNPNKADLSLISKALEMFKYHWYRDHSKSIFMKISRIDFAFDYPLPVNPCLVNFRLARCNNIHGGTSGVETVYYGSKRSAFNLKIYNKKLEYKKMQNLVYPGEFLWRIELQVNQGFFVQDFPGIINSLNRIEIFHSGQKTGDWKMDLLLKNAIHWGMANVLNDLPSTTKETYRKNYRDLQIAPLKHPTELYIENIKDCWCNLRNSILSAFGFDAENFVNSIPKDWNL